MAGGGGRSLEETPTWAVASVCFVLVAVSIVIEHIIHMIGKFLRKKNKKALGEALEKIKAELMLMGFISLLLTILQGPISEICISESVSSTWHPCSKQKEDSKYHKEEEADSKDSGHRRLFSVGEISRRVLAAGGEDRCAAKGKVPFVSSDGIHQLHVFIFVLALFHVLYCILTLALSRAKMKTWKTWEMDTKTADYQFSHDPERFRFTRDTSFGRRHLNFWSNRSVFLWIVCFFRQFFGSVPKVDYLTLRHGFVSAHLAPDSQTRFNFQKYIKRSLEEDFTVVVGISPLMWFFAVLFLLCTTHSSYSYFWLPFIPLVIILLVGTKLQVIITKMGLRFQDKGEVIKGSPLVQPADDLFWFGRPRVLLYLIHFVLFQNAFQLAFFAWSWYEFSLKSCYHERVEDIVIRISMGVIIQILCSYVTLPLYALVTQMGSTMNSTIFNDKVASAIRQWHHSAKKHVKQGRKSGTVTPLSSRPGTPSRSMSPVHLLNRYSHDPETGSVSPRTFFVSRREWEMMGEHSTSPKRADDDVPWAIQNEINSQEVEMEAANEPSSSRDAEVVHSDRVQHEIDILPTDFSFGRRSKASMMQKDKPHD